MPSLKYAIHVQAIPQCPPDTCRERDCEAYHFVHNPIGDSSFEVAAIAYPKRVFAPEARCQSYGLSMFRSEAQARARFAKLLNRHSQIRTRIGTHVAMVRLTGAHGVQGEENADGHFTLHEYVDVDFVPVSTLLGVL